MPTARFPEETLQGIDLLIPSNCTVTPDGALTVVDYEHGQNTSKPRRGSYRIAEDDKLHQWMKSFNPPIELPMMVSSTTTTGWNAHQGNGTDAGQSRGAAESGASIVEYAVESQRPASLLILKKCPTRARLTSAPSSGLAPAMHSVGLKLMIAAARDDVYDYEYFGKQCDAIVLMNYDQHCLFPRRPHRGTGLVR